MLHLGEDNTLYTLTHSPHLCTHYAPSTRDGLQITKKPYTEEIHNALHRTKIPHLLSHVQHLLTYIALNKTWTHPALHIHTRSARIPKLNPKLKTHILTYKEPKCLTCSPMYNTISHIYL